MSDVDDDGCYEVFWPRTPRHREDQPLAQRLGSLEGKTVAQLWDFVFRGDEVYELLEEGLKARFPGVRFVSWREFGCTHGGKEKEALAALPARFKKLGVDTIRLETGQPYIKPLMAFFEARRRRLR